VERWRGRLISKGDVSNASDIAILDQSVLAQFPALDTLINNAGIMRNLKLNQPRDLTDVTREIEINLSGPVRSDPAVSATSQNPQGRADHKCLVRLGFHTSNNSPVYSATKAAIHSYTQSLRAQLKGTSVTVVELAPPGVETPLFRGEFAEETKGHKGMDVKVLAKKAIAGIEAGKLEIRPGLSNVLKIMSRIAPTFTLN
jgi:uncharacterized oxidoreductase